MTETWTSEEYRYFLKNGKWPDRSPAIRAANVEQNPLDARKKKNADNKVSTRYRINVNRHSAKLCDIDNIASKWTTDALVIAGVIPDDTPEYLESVTYQQTKCKRSEEKTVIKLEAIEP